MRSKKPLYSQFKDNVRVRMYLRDRPGWVPGGQICHDLNLTSKSLGGIVRTMDDIERNRYLSRNALLSEYRYIGGDNAAA